MFNRRNVGCSFSLPSSQSSFLLGLRGRCDRPGAVLSNLCLSRGSSCPCRGTPNSSGVNPEEQDNFFGGISFEGRDFPFSPVTCQCFEPPCLDVDGIFKKFLLTYPERKRNHAKQGQRLAQPPALDRGGQQIPGERA